MMPSPQHSRVLRTDLWAPSPRRRSSAALGVVVRFAAAAGLEVVAWLLAVLLASALLLGASGPAQGQVPGAAESAVEITDEGPRRTELTVAQQRAVEELEAVRAELGPEMGLYDAPGSLMVRSATTGRYYRFPAVETEVQLRVTGVVVRGSVRQVFRNPAPAWVEGVYVFPLPDDAAVDTLRLEVGDRVLEGQIQERGEARRTYETAKAEGRKAALVEQERPNVFTNSVANIGPGEEVVVTLEYQHLARWDSGLYHLRFPTVVAPRYIPGSPSAAPLLEDLGTPSGHGWARNTDQVPDASRITPPVLHPHDGAPVQTASGGHEVASDDSDRGGDNGLRLEVVLEPGFELAHLDSPFFPVTVETSAGVHRVRLDDPGALANRDFELVWSPRRGAEPRAALLTETIGADTYGLMMVLPPQELFTQAERLPRELVLVVDTSGSMDGESIAQAQRALLEALETLREGDTFNLLRFASSTTSLFSQSRLATSEHLDTARRWVRDLEANGGTEMMGALQAALAGQEDASRLRQVIFITDGAVGNEDALFAAIEQRLAASRLFTVGIGSAPNSHFMRRAAQFGRGTFTHIGDLSQVREAMGELFAKIESPQLANLAVDWPDANAEMWPQRLPDLYRGEPLVTVVRLAPAAGASPAVQVRGQAGDRPWSAGLQMAAGESTSTAGISQLWARRKIESLMDRLTLGGADLDGEELREEILELALEHHLVSKFTSLVAVDITPTRPESEEVETRAVPVELPHGWSWEHVFGPSAGRGGATKAATLANTASASVPGSLPQGGTASTLWLLVGALLLAAGLLRGAIGGLGGTSR